MGQLERCECRSAPYRKARSRNNNSIFTSASSVVIAIVSLNCAHEPTIPNARLQPAAQPRTAWLVDTLAESVCAACYGDEYAHEFGRRNEYRNPLQLQLRPVARTSRERDYLFD